MRDRPDILWILSDELRADALGCYGHPAFQPRTPNLDRLASMGQRFTRSYCNSPVCVPSRWCMMTGRYPEQTGVYHNEASWGDCTYRPDQPPLPTMPEMLAKAGYRTANFGKLHIPHGIQPFQTHDWAGGGMGPLHDGATDTIVPPGIKTWIGGRFPGNRPYPAEQVTDKALDFLERHEREDEPPFLLRASYLQPHTPVFPPPPYDTMYAEVDFPDDPAGDADFAGANRFERRFGELVGGRRMDRDSIRRAKVYYYGLVSWLDAQVGRLLDALAASGRLERTLILFDADHGAALGEGGRYAKHVYSPEVHRVPRLLAWPGVASAGVVREDINEGLDVAATFLAAAGVARPEGMAGRDLIHDPEPEAVYATIGGGTPHDRVFQNLHCGDWYEGRGWPRRSCVRTRRLRLDMTTRIERRSPTPEEADLFLADSDADPLERVNLADHPDYQAERRRLEGLLADHVRDSVEGACVVTRDGADLST